MTPLGVVFLFMLVNWWVEKRQRFLFNVYKRFFYFGHVFYVFNVFLFFYGTFFTSMLSRVIAKLYHHEILSVATKDGIDCLDVPVYHVKNCIWRSFADTVL